MSNLPMAARIAVYVLVGITGLMLAALWVFQLGVLRGRRFENPDGSADDWHEQKAHYGIAFADLCVSAPAGIVGAVLAFLGSRWGFYLIALVSFWSVWANTMTTATSIKFFKPRSKPVSWFFGYPFGVIVGLAYLVLTCIYFDDFYVL